MIEAKVGTRVTLLKAPTDEDWKEVNRRARTTVDYTEGVVPSTEWRHAILRARHSPIRYLRWSFLIEDVPYWVACELRTHVHDMPYVADFGIYIRSQRNDRQDKYDRNAARQDAAVNMIIDCNGEQIQVLANKRLCNQATAEARAVVREMCDAVERAEKAYIGLLVPMCGYCGGICHEMKPCGRPWRIYHD